MIKQPRAAFTLTELVVAATLLVSVLAIVAPLSVRSNRMWQDSRHHWIATDELSNQLERLTATAPSEQTEAIEQLTVSDAVADALYEATLDGEFRDDTLGRRVILSLDWARPGDPPPLTMVGWVSASETATTEITATKIVELQP